MLTLQRTNRYQACTLLLARCCGKADDKDAAQLNTANRGTPPARAGPSSRGGSTARGGRPEQPSTRGGPSTRGASTRGRGGGRGAKVNTETVGVGIFGSARLQRASKSPSHSQCLNFNQFNAREYMLTLRISGKCSKDGGGCTSYDDA